MFLMSKLKVFLAVPPYKFAVPFFEAKVFPKYDNGRLIFVKFNPHALIADEVKAPLPEIFLSFPVILKLTFATPNKLFFMAGYSANNFSSFMLLPFNAIFNFNAGEI